MSRAWLVAALTIASVVAQLPALAPAVAQVAPAFAAATIDPIDAAGAAFVSDTHTVIAQPGETLTFRYQFRNTGTADWVKGGDDRDVSLAACEQVARTRSQFSINCGVQSRNPGWFVAPAPSIYADQEEATVAPGALGTFTWQVTVPSQTPAGEYWFFARPYRPEINRALGPVLKQMVRIPHGTLYIVNDTGDGATCSTDICTLRGAITLANTPTVPPSIDTIAFNVNGVSIISPASALPAITDGGVVIDGTTQLGYIDRPLIELRGGSAGAVNGLSIQKPSAIRGLAIGGFAKWAIEATAGGAGLIAGNFIGTNGGGSALLPNGTRGDAGTGGVHVLTPSFLIGTATLGDGNLVSGNFGQGIVVGSADAPGTTVMQNIVGQMRGGAAAGNEINGILVLSPRALVQDNVVASNRVGIGISANDGQYLDNVISNSTASGILMSGSRNTFDKNDIRGNGSSGVFMGFPDATTRSNTFTDNVVKDNVGDGFTLRGPAGDFPTEITDSNSIERGSISNNGGKGINLAFGANGGIQPPVITDVASSTDLPLIVSGTAALNATIQVYADPTDEGLTFLGSGISSDGDGTWSISTWAYADMSAIAAAVKTGALRLHATQTTALGTSEFSGAAATAITGIATCDGSTLLTGATVTLFSGSALVGATIANAETAAYRFAGVAPNATYTINISKFFPAIEGFGRTISCSASTTTDANGNSSVPTGVVIPNHKNHVWPAALDMADPAKGATALGTGNWRIDDYVFQEGQSTWFKVPVRPGQRVLVKVTNVPANYSVALYKDIAKLFAEQIASLAGTTAERLDAIARLDASVAPDALSPDALSPDELSPDELSPDALSPDALSPDELSPDELSPDELSPDELSPDALSPDALSPDALSPDELSPDALSPDALSSAYAGAQTAALIGVSAHVGLSPEQIARNTWDNSGYFYVRVRGHNGDYDAARPFTLEIKVTDVACTGVTLNDTPLIGFAPTGTARKSLFLTNTAQFPTGTDTAALRTKLNTFAGRADIAGAVVDLKDIPGVASAYAIWNAAQDCPAAANIVARRIKDVIAAYRATSAGNPDLKYIVLAGNDHVVPFFRIPDQSGLGSEKDYRPAVQDPTASQASLRFGYVLTQDFYGANGPISRFDHQLYVPDLAVGRLVETVADMSAVIDAYPAANNGFVSPTRALVAGYDFLADAAGFIADQFVANLLTTDRQLIQPVGESPTGPNAWTAAQLRSKLFGPTTFGILSLNAHFSGNSLLAADYATRILSTEISALPASDLRFRNALILSTGCHSGYNIVDREATALTQPIDWAQAFASRGATLIGGTGYQYGDTDFMKYSEQILANVTLELRYGSGAIPIGVALANAKRTYLSSLVSFKGIDEKAMAEATLYGLPMLGYNLPAGSRLSPPDNTNTLGLTGLVSAGLSYADLTPAYTLTGNTRPLTVQGSAVSTTATYYDIAGSVAVSPEAPVLPLTQHNVAIAGQAVRGAVLMSADYLDESPMTPFTDVATTEVRGAHPRYVTEVFTPVRPFDLNQFSGSNLLTTPFQYRSLNSGTTGIGRRFTTESLRLYYSDLTDMRALAGAPVVYTAALTPNADPTKVDVSVTVGSLATVGVEEVWATYTGETGALYGHWASLRLTRTSTATHFAGTVSEYTGSIPRGSTPVADVRALIQAVGGNGLVTWASNDGAYYRVVTETATAATPKITTALSLVVPASGSYLQTVTVRARLMTGSAGLNGKRVSFRSGGVRVDATTATEGATGQAGWATAQLPLVSAPGAAAVSVGFAEDALYLGSGAEGTILVTKAASSFVASDTTILSGGSVVLATLMGAGAPLGGYLVTISAGNKVVQTFTDGYGRVRLDTLDGLPAGGYSVTLGFAGNDRYLAAGSVTVAVPSAFVTAGGWIMTTSESLHLVAGKKANFSVNAKYKNGSTVPTGNVEFKANESNVTFKATTFDSMTVSGTTVDLQGHGTVNGAGGWTFRVRLVEGTPDSFAISIWHDGEDPNIVTPFYRAANSLGGGNVVVH